MVSNKPFLMFTRYLGLICLPHPKSQMPDFRCSRIFCFFSFSCYKDILFGLSHEYLMISLAKAERDVFVLLIYESSSLPSC